MVGEGERNVIRRHSSLRGLGKQKKKKESLGCGRRGESLQESWGKGVRHQFETNVHGKRHATKKTMNKKEKKNNSTGGERLLTGKISNDENRVCKAAKFAKNSVG